ncbi:MAG: hypothetical protein WBN32_12105 [Woeseia sp.]
MNPVKINRRPLATLACAALLLSGDAFAYIDPGTGTLLIQWLFGIVMASFAALNIYWDRVKTYFYGKSQKTAVSGEFDGGADDTRAE